MTNDRQGRPWCIGATGGIGGEAARALAARGWRVRALRRQASGKARPDLAGIEWVEGDAMRAGDVLAAAAGAQVIVHGANPPGYHNWQGTVASDDREHDRRGARPRARRSSFPARSTISAPTPFPCSSEASPQNPKTRKGALRVAMEQRLAAAAADGVRAIDRPLPAISSVRAPATTGSRRAWSSRASRSTAITYPGRAGTSATPGPICRTSAETIARLVEAGTRLAPFAVFHMRGHWLRRGRRDGGSDPPRRSAMPTCRSAACPGRWSRSRRRSYETFREMLEMRYLWREPLRLDNAPPRGLPRGRAAYAARRGRPRHAARPRLPAGRRKEPRAEPACGVRDRVRTAAGRTAAGRSARAEARASNRALPEATAAAHPSR